MQGTISTSELEGALHRAGIRVSGSIIPDKCRALCIQYSVTVDDFISELEAFRVNNEVDTIELLHMGKIEEAIRVRSNDLKSHQHSSSSQNVSRVSKRLNETGSNTPSKRVAVLKSSTSPGFDSSPDRESSPSQLSQTGLGGSGKYASRTGTDQRVITLNGHIQERGNFISSTSKPLGARVRLELNSDDFDGAYQRYRYMFTSIAERAQSLEKQMLRLEGDMMTASVVNELHPVGVQAQELVWVCGRICNDAAEGKINATSVMLEGSRHYSGGRRVHLDLQELQSYALFPGQIIMVQGLHTSPTRIAVKAIVEGVPRPLAMTSPSRLHEYHHSPLYQGGQPVTIMCAAGPFTPADDLNYQPFQDLLYKIIQEKPDVLILTGPFVDITQPLLSSGAVKLSGDPDSDLPEHVASYETLFMEKILRDGLLPYFNEENASSTLLPTHIVLIPSLLDGHHDYVFPQPPFGERGAVKSKLFAEELGKLQFPFSSSDDPKKRVHLLPNPCIFRVNETVIGATSNDVLFSLSSDEVSANCGNRMTRLAAHTLEQQSFAPMFPAPANSHQQIDLRHSRQWQMKVTPDVLLLPSKLSPVAKDIHGSLVVNPGQLVKGTGGGTFAKLTISPISADTFKNSTSDSPVLHNVHSRTRVEIIKI